ncbi:hypothetical protein [Paractinoplanes lichenicola]|uniref:Uncharacterized protein n=1 Tax=Paractinoplanes lichenicola TaxID=2802976 RepID=A0ABS1W248_9ACTN|nr:hypothetical protein [Actinoplanes lichenicola]MBL7260628.1 hypothetical protein [Actinoplanes lichenicola]
MRRISAELVHHLTDFRMGHDLAPVGMSAVPRYWLNGTTVTALDDQLRPVRRRDIAVPAGGKLLAGTPDLTTVVLATHHHLTVHTGDRALELNIEAADSATLIGDDRLLVTAPVIELRNHYGQPYESQGEHVVQLIDVRSGAVADRAVLDVVSAGVFAVPHPYDGSIVLDAGMGQDGSAAFVARVAGDRLSIEPLREDVVVSGFDPSGRHLLLMPHPGFDDVATVLEWPSLHTTAELSGATLAFDDGGIDMYGCYLSDNRIVLQAGEVEQNGALLCSAGLTPLAWLEFPPNDPTDSELVSIHGVGPNLFAAEVWSDGAETVAVWRLPQR